MRQNFFSWNEECRLSVSRYANNGSQPYYQTKKFAWNIIIYYVRKRNLEKGREDKVFLMNREVCSYFLKRVGGRRYPSAIKKEFDEQRMAEL